MLVKREQYITEDRSAESLQELVDKISEVLGLKVKTNGEDEDYIKLGETDDFGETIAGFSRNYWIIKAKDNSGKHRYYLWNLDKRIVNLDSFEEVLKR